VSRAVIWGLYAALVIIWSSTWVVIKIGLEDLPPLLGAGIRFAIAGVGLLAIASVLGTAVAHGRQARGRARPPAVRGAYGLIYWGEQFVPSGLAAVLFGVMPLYSAVLASLLLAGEPLRARLLGGIALALAGLSLAFGESVALGDDEWALAAAFACAAAPLASAVGNVAIKRRGSELDAIVLNGWAMLAGGLLLLAVSGVFEAWEVTWSGRAIGSIAYLAVIGSAVPFVTLTVLLRELPAVTVSYISLLLPFGALAFGAALYDEAVTLAARRGSRARGGWAGVRPVAGASRGGRRGLTGAPRRRHHVQRTIQTRRRRLPGLRLRRAAPAVRATVPGARGPLRPHVG
jgi:drug/metabolite transporter (DMT)-like permease